ncbi:MAG TPA: glutathione S-transferase family protein [Micropepsaceae bacterium]|nr:glutathione S-transferase family protein [Micropepsaceae bacterium]
MSARYTLFIGSKNTSSWSLRPWLAMKMAKLPFEEVLIALRRPETKDLIKPHSPSGKVPALRIEEGAWVHTVWDSLAICETLAERHPDARLWPVDSWARAEARSVAAEMHSGFPDLRNALSMEIAARHPTPALDDAVQGQIARIVAIWESALARFGKEGGFLFGRFTIADAFYAPVVTRFRTYGIALPPAAQAYMQRILALESMREWEDAALAQVANS